MVKWLCFFKHDLKLTSVKEGQVTQQQREGPEQTGGVTTISGTLNIADGAAGPLREPEDPDKEYDDDTAPGFCCWKGCITGSLVVFLFFIVFPAGILIINYSSNDKDTPILIVGILLTVLPLIAFIIIILAIFYRRKVIKRERRKHKEQQQLQQNNKGR